jgi:outer membrane protein assembly factor BamD
MRHILPLVIIVLMAACASRNAEQAFFSEVGALTKEEILAKGDAAVAEKDYQEGRRYYSFLADSFPNDPVGRQAALKVADSFFNARDSESMVEAQLRYKDFSNRFPNDSGRPYALMMLGKTHHHQQRGPMRDLTPLLEAVQAFKQVVELYPDSSYAQEAQAFLDSCNRDLALHEFEVAEFYYKQGAYEGAHQRLTFLLATYPDTEEARRGAALLERINELRTGR